MNNFMHMGCELKSRRWSRNAIDAQYFVNGFSQEVHLANKSKVDFTGCAQEKRI